MTVVVGAPNVDELVVATFKFVAMVSNICGKIGWGAVGTNKHFVLFFAPSGTLEPVRAVLFIDIAFIAKDVNNFSHIACIMQALFAEPTVVFYAKTFQAVGNARNFFF